MQIKLLAEGSKRWERFIKHWGIAFLIGDDVLFDTFGEARVFSRNLKTMKVDISRIRHVIISHDHWDHLAGLWPILEQHEGLTVYICPGFSRETKERIASFGVRVVEAGEFTEIRKDIYTTGQIRGRYAGQDIYEQSVVVKTFQGLVVITGCAHPGIAAIINKVREEFLEKIFLVMGGFHLKGTSQEKVERVIDMLKTTGVQKVSPLHCTGAGACGIFENFYGADYINFRIGQSLEI